MTEPVVVKGHHYQHSPRETEEINTSLRRIERSTINVEKGIYNSGIFSTMNVAINDSGAPKSGHTMAPKALPFNEATYQSLLVLAENYRLARPPRIRMCVHCLMAVLNISPPPQTRLRTHLQIGSLLLKYTENIQLAQSHFRAAFGIAKSTGNTVAYFEASSLLAETLCKLSDLAQAKQLLRDGVAASQHNNYWHARLLLQLACIHHRERDHVSARQLLDVGAEISSNSGSDYLKILFLLSKGMILLLEQKLDEVNLVLSMCGQLIDSMKNSSQIQIEAHKVYFLTLQVAHLLSGGQVKSVKISLKQLQHSIQGITGLPNSVCGMFQSDSSMNLKEMHEVEDIMKSIMSSDGFLWLQREPMCILVYLVTVTYSMLAGYLDKAQKYTDKALKQIKKLKITDPSPLLTQLELMFLEHIAQCHLVMCDKKAALQKITLGCHLCAKNPTVQSITQHTTQMHTLLGMYSMSMNQLDQAEKHLQIAVKKSTHNEQIVTNMLNLALVYMHNYQLTNGTMPQAKQQELIRILSQINPDSVVVKSRNLKATSFYVKGMFSFFQASYSDAKRFLRETLKMANAQDLNRLTACALVLLGHIYLSVDNHQESMNMVLPAMQLANKIPDLSVKLWASALLRDLYKLCGDEEHFTENKTVYEKLASKLASEHASAEASPHKIIEWLSEDVPPMQLFDEGSNLPKDEALVQIAPAVNVASEIRIANTGANLGNAHSQMFSTPPHAAATSYPGMQLPGVGINPENSMMGYPNESFNQKPPLPASEPTEMFPSPMSGLVYHSPAPHPQPESMMGQNVQKTPLHQQKSDPVLQSSMPATTKSNISNPMTIAASIPQHAPGDMLMSVHQPQLPGVHGGAIPNHRMSISENQMFHNQPDQVLFASHGLLDAHSDALSKTNDTDYLAKMAAQGFSMPSQQYPLLNNFPKSQQHQQALLQQQMQMGGHMFQQANRANLHLYQQGVQGGVPQQNMGEHYPIQNKIEMPLGQNMQQIPWPQQGHSFQPRGNYNWR